MDNLKPCFKNVIVRKPCPNVVNGITSVDLGVPDYNTSLIQHQNYCDTFKTLGIKVEILDALNDFPDSTFVEDVALLTPKCAIITNPGAPSRKGEIISIRPILENYYSNIEQILPEDGTVEAGDIMMVGTHFYIGVSERTTEAGGNKMIQILNKYGFTGSLVPLKTMLHLKSGVSYLEDNTILVCGEFVDSPIFQSFKKIVIDEDEAYASNSVWVNGKVLTPKGFPKTLKKLEEAGFDLIVLDVSEFRKIDGGLSCLSLRF